MATCGEVLVKILENYGVDTVFGIPGVHTVELYRGLPATSIKHITPRHEQGAGFMADGYARSTGKVGVCLIITGPGMTNIMTAMAQALQDSIPMLVISSVNQTHQLALGEGRLHELPNQQNVVSGVCAFSHTLMRADELPKILARAYAVFNSDRPAPVHIEIPIDIITSLADHLDTRAWPLASAPGPSPVAIVEAAGWLKGATRPLIAIGGGAQNASVEIKQLAEILGAPVINTVNAKGALPYSHPLAVGGSSSCALVKQELEQSDVVVGIGTEFGETDYDYFFQGLPELNGKLIRIDIDASQLTRNVRPDLAICSDAAFAVSALINEIGEHTPKGDGATRASTIKGVLQKGNDPKYAAFFDAIREALPEVIIAGDSTQPIYYAWTSYETEAPRRYFHSASGYGTLGYAIPAAIGAKIGNPDQPVIGMIGDGAAQFTIGEFASAVEAEVNVIFLLWNNIGYGEIRRFMNESGIEEIGVNIGTPNFLPIAEGFGLNAARVSNLEDLKHELILANERSGPSFIEVMELDFTDGFPANEALSKI